MIKTTLQSPQQLHQALPQSDIRTKPVQNDKTKTGTSALIKDEINLATPSSRAMSTINFFPDYHKPTEAEIQWALQLEEKVKSGYRPTAQETARYSDIAQRLSDSQRNTPSPYITDCIPPMPPRPKPLNLVQAQWAKDMAQRIEFGYYQPTQQEMNHFMKIAEQAIDEKLREFNIQWPASISEPPDSDELRWASSVARDNQLGETTHPRQLKHFAEIVQMVMEANLAARKPQPVRGVTQAELNWAIQLQDNIQQGYQPSQEEVTRYSDIYERYQNQEVTPTPSPYPFPPVYHRPLNTAQPSDEIVEIFKEFKAG